MWLMTKMAAGSKSGGQCQLGQGDDWGGDEECEQLEEMVGGYTLISVKSVGGRVPFLLSFDVIYITILLFHVIYDWI